MDAGTIDLAKCQETRIRDALTLKHYPPVPIDMNIPEVVDLLVSYNFLPVVDDRDSFVGIVTRNKILKKLSDANHGEKKVTTTISYGNPSLFTPNI